MGKRVSASGLRAGVPTEAGLPASRMEMWLTRPAEGTNDGHGRRPMAAKETYGILTPAQMAQAAEDAAYNKAVNRPLASFLLGLTAGAYIGLGFVFFVTSRVGAEGMPWGVSQVLGGVVFSTGLVLVVLTGAELFTSSTITLTAKASGRITWWQLLRNWGVVYVANFIGALVLGALIYAAGTWRLVDGGWGAVVLESAATKVQYPFLQAFALGVLCNLLVCLAIWAAYSGRTTTDKVVAIGMVTATTLSVDHRRRRFLVQCGSGGRRLQRGDLGRILREQPVPGDAGQHRRWRGDDRRHVLDDLPPRDASARGAGEGRRRQVATPHQSAVTQPSTRSAATCLCAFRHAPDARAGTRAPRGRHPAGSNASPTRGPRRGRPVVHTSRPRRPARP